MKYKYDFEIFKLNLKDNGSLTMGVGGNNVGPLNGLFQDINSKDTKDWYINGIEAVIAGNIEVFECGGELVHLEVKKDKTHIENAFDENETGWIETTELKELIEIWWAKFKEFYKV
jgi:hypothetical protein